MRKRGQPVLVGDFDRKVEYLADLMEKQGYKDTRF